MRAFGRLLCLLLLALGPTACVTTTTGGFSADREKEISERVDAATQYLAKGNTEQAVVHLRRALELDPNAAPVHETLARVFVQTGEYEPACPRPPQPPGGQHEQPGVRVEVAVLTARFGGVVGGEGARRERRDRHPGSCASVSPRPARIPRPGALLRPGG
ncbi:MAG: tetratricopeptide repeat protein, partial [Gammaproteobacteria bacterium]